MSQPYRLSSPEDFYIGAADIQTAVQEVGEEILELYSGKTGEITAITVLRGAAPFARDLVPVLRNGGLRVAEDSMRITSYEKTKSNGEPVITQDTESDLEGKHLLVIEDIKDTGLTLGSLVNHLKGREPASVTVTTMLDKPERAIPGLVIDAPILTGFTIADRFVVGYGLDYEEQYRELPFIVICEPVADGSHAPVVEQEPVASSLSTIR